jgi:hypothetical protein
MGKAEETEEQVRGFAPIGIVELWNGGMMGLKEFCQFSDISSLIPSQLIPSFRADFFCQ